MNNPEEPKSAVDRYAFIQSELRKARKEKLKELGETEESVRELEDEVFALIEGEGFAKTEFGSVQIIPAIPVQWRARRSVEDTGPTIYKRKLIFLSND